MYNKIKDIPSKLSINKAYQGERIEEKIQRITNNKEPISDGAPLVYTERKKGVEPQYNIRTDRWDIAIDAMDKVSKTSRAKRDATPEMKAIKGENKDGGAEPIQAIS